MPKTPEEVRSYYQQQLDTYAKNLDQTKKQIRKTALFRISSFLLTVIGIYISSGFGWLPITIVSLVGFGLFVYFVIKHAQLFKQRQWLEAFIKINQTEMELLSGNTDQQPEGKQFITPDHPFIDDLDIFGKRSLFQLINRCATNGGTARLASTLSSPLKNIDQLEQRQNSIKELCGKPEWRQEFQATGELNTEEAHDVDEIKSWAASTKISFQTFFYKLMLILNPVLGFGVIVAIAFNGLGFGFFILFLFVPFAIVGTKIAQINHEHSQLSRRGDLLKRYAELFGLVEKETFESDLLAKAKSQLSSGEHSAKMSLASLSDISAKLDYRLNLLAGLFLNIFFLWDIRQCIRLEKWKANHQKDLNNWFDTLFEIDELNSFAGFAFNHPDSVYPDFSNAAFELTATNAKHPFIATTSSVGNEIHISGWKQFQIITGANMAGKSTYLRTVGINLLLAMTGAPVLADQFTFTPVDLFTGIKTTDSLQDGESYFFAELKRLKYIIDLLADGKQLFIILDEILRGTNSADKQKGSKALISQLVRLGASGMIATHDLSLGELIKSFPENIKNKRFEVEITNDELVFDYQLKDGISQNLNASFLMEKMGIVLGDKS
jgi:hypothetical protein